MVEPYDSLRCLIHWVSLGIFGWSMEPTSDQPLFLERPSRVPCVSILNCVYICFWGGKFGSLNGSQMPLPTNHQQTSFNFTSTSSINIFFWIQPNPYKSSLYIFSSPKKSTIPLQQIPRWHHPCRCVVNFYPCRIDFWLSGRMRYHMKFYLPNEANTKNEWGSVEVKKDGFAEMGEWSGEIYVFNKSMLNFLDILRIRILAGI